MRSTTSFRGYLTMAMYDYVTENPKDLNGAFTDRDAKKIFRLLELFNQLIKLGYEQSRITDGLSFHKHHNGDDLTVINISYSVKFKVWFNIDTSLDSVPRKELDILTRIAKIWEN